MVELSLDEFMRAFAFARALKKERPKADFHSHLVERLGEMIFWHEARRALSQKDIGPLNWFAMPQHVADRGIDLRIDGWKIDVKTPSGAMLLHWPACKRADLFPMVQIDKSCLRELAARYKAPTRSRPIGLIDDPVMIVTGTVAGWIGIGSAEEATGDHELTSRVDDQLASAHSLWTLLQVSPGPDVKQADAAWRQSRELVTAKVARPRRVAPSSSPALLPPRRSPRRASAA